MTDNVPRIRPPSRRTVRAWSALAAVALVLGAGCAVPKQGPGRSTIVVDGTSYDLRATVDLGQADGTWAARLLVPPGGGKLVASFDTPLQAGPAGAAFVALLDGNGINAQGDLFRRDVPTIAAGSPGTSPPHRFQAVEIFRLSPGSPTVILAWTGVAGNATIQVAFSSGVGFANLGKATGATPLRPDTMRSGATPANPLLRAGSLDRRLDGPALLWGDFALDRLVSGDLTVTAAGGTHSGHVDPQPVPTVSSYAGIWNGTDLQVSYVVKGADTATGPESGLYGAVLALPPGVPAPGWLDATCSACV